MTVGHSATQSGYSIVFKTHSFVTSPHRGTAIQILNRHKTSGQDTATSEILCQKARGGPKSKMNLQNSLCF